MTEPSFGKILIFMAIFVLVGMPLVAFLWETLNDLLALQPVASRMINSIPALLIFVGLLALLSNRISRLMPPNETG